MHRPLHRREAILGSNCPAPSAAVTDSADRSQRNALFKKADRPAPPQLEQVLFILNPPSGNIPTAEAPAANRVAKLLEWAQSQQGCKLPAVEEAIEQALQTTGWNRQTENSAQLSNLQDRGINPQRFCWTPGRPQTACTTASTLYQAQGRYGEAEPLYLRVIEIGIKTLPAEHPKIADRLNNFAGYGSRGSGGGAGRSAF